MSDMSQGTVSVLDFRRRRMAVQWNVASGGWSSHEEAPALVHGIALIRPAADNLCLYGHDGALILQIGAEHHVLADAGTADPDATPAGITIQCDRIALSLGMRRQIIVKSRDGNALFTHQYWIGSHADFFKLLADKTASAEWRAACARTWSDGVSSTLLRQSWAR